jgi:hypothetical protein
VRQLFERPLLEADPGTRDRWLTGAAALGAELLAGATRPRRARSFFARRLEGRAAGPARRSPHTVTAISAASRRVLGQAAYRATATICPRSSIATSASC